MSSEPASSSPQTALDAYLDDAMGIRFDALSRFATPLFELYGVDLQASFANRLDENHAPEEVHTLVTVLDTTRLFWSYFSLDEAAQRRHRPAFKHCLIGAAPDADAEASFNELVAMMREQWTALPASMRAHACTSIASTLPPFEQLIEQHANPVQHASAPPVNGYGPQQLEQPEALALFAQPLLDDPAVHADAEVLEARMARATAYWELAHAAPSDRPHQLEALVARFAEDPNEREHLRNEARTMLDRFEELFSKRDA